jgi:hypothetical protein
MIGGQVPRPHVKAAKWLVIIAACLYALWFLERAIRGQAGW